ncbi:MAG: caspase family protein [Blastocatellia bacterium]|nr:caspase family protein [Blastocatellia bacterium]
MGGLLSLGRPPSSLAMHTRIILSLILYIASIIASHAAQTGQSQTITAEGLREPFILELPELKVRITSPFANIPTADVRKVRFIVLKRFADSINYGRIFTKVNGESMTHDVGPVSEGYQVVCDLDSRPRFRLRPGKNVLEIQAIDRSRRSYFASFVLVAGDSAAGDSLLATGATLETSLANSGEDRLAPAVTLIEPSSPVRQSATIRVYGTAEDDSGTVASVTVANRPARLSPAPARRGAVVVRPAPSSAALTGAVAFERTFQVPADADSVVIEARDRAGNVARVLIPVVRREAVISSKFSGRKFAVIIGISDYKYERANFSDLQYAHVDARAVNEFLRRRDGGGFADSDILFMENEGASTQAVRAALDRFLSQAGRDDLVLIYLAGHGSNDPHAPQNLYFLMHDTNVDDMSNTALPMTELKQALDTKVKAERVVVFIDTCHSAGLTGEKPAARGGENNLINLYASKLFAEKGRAVITASDVNESSFEDRRWGGGHGVFTFVLLEGLSGKADADRDGLVKAGELFAYVRERVREETGNKQNPRALPGLNADLSLSVAAKR